MVTKVFRGFLEPSFEYNSLSNFPIKIPKIIVFSLKALLWSYQEQSIGSEVCVLVNPSLNCDFWANPRGIHCHQRIIPLKFQFSPPVQQNPSFFSPADDNLRRRRPSSPAPAALPQRSHQTSPPLLGSSGGDLSACAWHRRCPAVAAAAPTAAEPAPELNSCRTFVWARTGEDRGPSTVPDLWSFWCRTLSILPTSGLSPSLSDRYPIRASTEKDIRTCCTRTKLPEDFRAVNVGRWRHMWENCYLGFRVPQINDQREFEFAVEWQPVGINSLIDRSIDRTNEGEARNGRAITRRRKDQWIFPPPSWDPRWSCDPFEIGGWCRGLRYGSEGGVPVLTPESELLDLRAVMLDRSEAFVGGIRVP